jgi:hypothetical protein
MTFTESYARYLYDISLHHPIFEIKDDDTDDDGDDEDDEDMDEVDREEEEEDDEVLLI